MTKKQPKIGSWYGNCCCEDVSQIETEEELQEVLEDLSEQQEEYYDGGGFTVFETIEECIQEYKWCSCPGIICKRFGIEHEYVVPPY